METPITNKEDEKSLFVTPNPFIIDDPQDHVPNSEITPFKSSLPKDSLPDHSTIYNQIELVPEETKTINVWGLLIQIEDKAISSTVYEGDCIIDSSEKAKMLSDEKLPSQLNANQSYKSKTIPKQIPLNLKRRKNDKNNEELKTDRRPETNSVFDYLFQSSRNKFPLKIKTSQEITKSGYKNRHSIPKREVNSSTKLYSNVKDNNIIAENFNRKVEEEFKILDPDVKGSIDFPSLGEILLNFGCIDEFDKSTQPARVKALWDYLIDNPDATTVSNEIVSNALKDILLIPNSDNKQNKLHKIFYALYASHLANGKTKHVKGAKFVSPREHFTFRPRILKKSHVLATEKLAKEYDGSNYKYY